MLENYEDKDDYQDVEKMLHDFSDKIHGQAFIGERINELHAIIERAVNFSKPKTDQGIINELLDAVGHDTLISLISQVLRDETEKLATGYFRAKLTDEFLDSFKNNVQQIEKDICNEILQRIKEQPDRYYIHLLQKLNSSNSVERLTRKLLLKN